MVVGCWAARFYNKNFPLVREFPPCFRVIQCKAKW